MTVNHGGNLSVEYFESYLNLIMSTRQFSPEDAKCWMEQDFFKGNPFLYGEPTHHSFLEAVKKVVRSR